MLKRRIAAVVAGLALLLAVVAGPAGVAADAFGLPVTPNTASASGGGC